MSDTLAAVRQRAIGTTAEVITAEPALSAADEILRTRLAELDAAASRFRPDSEISLLLQHCGQPVGVSPLLGQLLRAARHAARQTNGAVDPTVGSSLVALGYDRDFDEIADEDEAVHPQPAPGPGSVGWNGIRREVTLADGVLLDLGATAKAWAADRIAAEIGRVTGAPVLVNLGGDISIAGEAPDGGWPIHIGDDHRERPSSDGEAIALTSGGLATSSSSVRTWRRGGRALSHIVDPRTGEPTQPIWRSVSVVAASALDANTASTAAMVMGLDAPAWLDELRVAARLVRIDGSAMRVGAWP